ncbi:hypothetical protein SAICODRAFT_25961 [Saitoella complicata NRRL Y-17804]|uniref:uncharacterized protein n=1 Tax=Saitoella complicata (strain BCRC 22490 / CBS 7301 / JCM 7358 / NBRC 10748 / NRRL Y-17804) TaxID=698492 RepID=UPI000868231D|nr:uncharacterized protein SAICODRAFT_25961 [Saitoella complicata NRRL Y-17804]ODQ52272.1 hypothetical protein SAICODRAFT_25961 [Saitoella complicata NRRL Y-17804]
MTSDSPKTWFLDAFNLPLSEGDRGFFYRCLDHRGGGRKGPLLIESTDVLVGDYVNDITETLEVVADAGFLSDARGGSRDHRAGPAEDESRVPWIGTANLLYVVPTPELLEQVRKLGHKVRVGNPVEPQMPTIEASSGVPTGSFSPISPDSGATSTTFRAQENTEASNSAAPLVLVSHNTEDTTSSSQAPIGQYSITPVEIFLYKDAFTIEDLKNPPYYKSEYPKAL